VGGGDNTNSTPTERGCFSGGAVRADLALLVVLLVVVVVQSPLLFW